MYIVVAMYKATICTWIGCYWHFSSGLGNTNHMHDGEKMMKFLTRWLKVKCMVQLRHVSFLSIVQLPNLRQLLMHQKSRAIAEYVFHPLTQLLLEKRPCNVKTDRYFIDGKFSWNQLLTQLNILFPEVLLCSFVCQASFNECIAFQT